MKKRLLIIIWLFLVTTVHSQPGVILSSHLIPTLPTDADSILLVVDAQFTSGGCALSQYFLLQTGNDIVLEFYHCTGALSVICNITDTFSVGYLPAGTYNLDLILSTGNMGFDPDCTSFQKTDSTNGSFTVDPFPTSVGELSISKPSLVFPNPCNHPCEIHLPIKGGNWSGLKISDVTGRIVIEFTSLMPDVPVRVAMLNPGIYFYSLYDEQMPTATGKFIVGNN